VTRICRFNDNRLGIVDHDAVIDVTGALDALPSVRWPVPLSDLLIEHLDHVIHAAKSLMSKGARHSIQSVKFLSPVANAPKVIAAPVNYLRHQQEANADGGKNFVKEVKTIDEYGLFLKASSSVIGMSEGIEIAYPDRRTDHEIELVAVIGKQGRNVSRARALEHIAGYCLGLDMTLRGPEDRSLRKSLDSYSVVGPWLVTADEVPNPNALSMTLTVNGQCRQRATTADLIFNVERLVEYASAHYTLHAGDIIFTGTPEGVGPVVAGDRIDCTIEGIGSASVVVRGASTQYHYKSKN
jgi:2,4-diketo-3-deoxy-L-fuconate hydrolase